jgi:hypothetical protein
MTPEQRDNVILLCEKAEEIDITSSVLNFDVKSIGVFTIEIFESLFKRMAKQLKDELISGIGLLLPHQYQYQNEFGAGNLEGDLQNFITYISNPSYYSNTEGILSRLIYYQIANGFWDRGQRKIYSTNEVKVRDLRDKIQSLETIVRKELEKVTNEKNNLSDFVSQKTNELQQIQRNLNAADISTKEINNLLNQSTANSEKINSILTQQSDKLEETKENLDENKKEFTSNKTDLLEFSQNIQVQIKDFDSKDAEFAKFLVLFEDKQKYFDERNRYLDQLIGREVGTSLFETFKQRKTELNQPVFYWRLAVPAITLVVVGWIFFLFSGFASIQDINLKWQFFAINTLKTIPSIFLMYFVINQYRKERNFQEEYAFKSAVALTIQAYAAQLNSEENQDKLILDAVSKVYTSPFPQNQVVKVEDNKNFLEGVKSVKDTVAEAIKSSK